MNVQLRWGLRLLAVAVALLCVVPAFLDRETVFWLGEEDGPIERGSIWVWLAAAAWMLGRAVRARRWLPLAFALVMLLMGVREAGLQPEVVPSGKALLSWRYYVDAGIDPLRRLVTGVLVLAFLVSLIASVGATLRYLWRQQGWRRPDGQFFMLAFALLVVAQLAEGWAGHRSTPDTDRLVLVSLMLEEGLEGLGAVFTLAASALRDLWLFRGAQAGQRQADGGGT